MGNYTVEDYIGNSYYRVKHISGENARQSSRHDYHHSLNLFFIYFKKGSGRINIENELHELREGELILINPSELYFYEIDDGVYHERIDLSANVIRMMKSFPCDISTVFSPLYKRAAGVSNVISAEKVKEYGLDRMYGELLEIICENNESSKALSFCKIVELLCRINKIIELAPEQSKSVVNKDSLINKVLEYVNKNFSDDISIQSIADHFSVHRSYLLHKFKEQMNIPLWDYVIKRRIFKFNSLVKENTALEEAAYQVGFTNYSNFYRLYKKNMGITPLKFKMQLKVERAN